MVFLWFFFSLYLDGPEVWVLRGFYLFVVRKDGFHVFKQRTPHFTTKKIIKASYLLCTLLHMFLHLSPINTLYSQSSQEVQCVKKLAFRCIIEASPRKYKTRSNQTAKNKVNWSRSISYIAWRSGHKTHSTCSG